MALLTQQQRAFAKQKIENTKFYLDNHFIGVDNKIIPLSDFYKNPIVNAHRYVSEIQHRVWSLYHYARIRGLVNVFVTITLPSEYHPKRTITLKNGNKKFIPNDKYIDDEEHSPKSGSYALSRMLKELFDDRAYKSIPKDDRVYFRVTEPHKDGTPHLHISFFIPQENVERFIRAVERKYSHVQFSVESNIQNPVAYLMKYVLKTLDDMRRGTENITDLSLWYIYHGIGRFYTSRTLISLDVYRALGGRYTLNMLTQMYKDREIIVFLTEDNKLYEIYEGANRIYHKKTIDTYDPENVPMGKLSLPEKRKPAIPVSIDDRIDHVYVDEMVKPINHPVSKMPDYELYDYYLEIKEDYEVNPQRYAVVRNEMIDRHLLEEEKISPNAFIYDDLFGEDTR